MGVVCLRRCPVPVHGPCLNPDLFTGTFSLSFSDYQTLDSECHPPSRLHVSPVFLVVFPLCLADTKSTVLTVPFPKSTTLVTPFTLVHPFTRCMDLPTSVSFSPNPRSGSSGVFATF